LAMDNQIAEGESDRMQPYEKQYLVSSPGKVILFGEHAVVYGVPALAASVSLRCYAIATPYPRSSSHKVGVHFIDIDAGDKEEGFRYEWNTDDLPWHAVPVVSQASEVPLDLDFLDEISRVALPEGLGSHARQASLAFLYLYMVFSKDLESTTRPSFTLSVRATLPVGAGLGSSAAYSVCTTTALMLITGRISPPPPSDSGSSPSVLGSDRLPRSLADAVNVYAFLSEKILHGNPSGVDNSVAVYGGGLLYTKSIPSEGKVGGMVSIEGFTSHRFLLTDTRVPRNTKELVGSVATQKAADPERVGKVLNDIQALVEKAASVLSGSGDEILAALIDENHRLLDELRVSHPSLETVRRITRADPYNLATKLTGAGGGGCAVTLIPTDFSSSKLTSVISTLESERFTSETFRTHLTEVGGLGLGILSSSANLSDLPTPPSQTSLVGSDSLEVMFANMAKVELKGWMEGLGKWAYV